MSILLGNSDGSRCSINRAAQYIPKWLIGNVPSIWALSGYNTDNQIENHSTCQAPCTLKPSSGADAGFQVRGGHLKKIAPSRGRREHFWGISCEKSRFYAKKIIFFPILGGARAGCAPLWIRPCSYAD